MSRERQSRTKLNNQGMSLVEVLVAMIIISIAGVAFLQSFTYATKYNILSREKQHAMGLAQSIMEDFKAYSLEDMDGKFSGSSFDLYTLASATNNSVSTEAPKRKYHLEDVIFNGKYKYDVDIVATPAVSTFSSGVAYVSPQPYDKTDAIFVEDIEYEIDYIVNHVWTQLHNTTFAPESLFPGFKDYLDNYVSDPYNLKEHILLKSREISIDFKQEAGGVKASAQIQYDFKVNSFEYDYTDINTGITVTKNSPAIDFSNITIPSGGNYQSSFYDSQSLGKPFDKAYIYYYPQYSRATGLEIDQHVTWAINTSSTFQDSIKLSSDLTESRNVFLIKQKLPDFSNPGFSMADTTMKQWDNDYQPTVTNVGGLIQLYTNLSKRLYEDGACTFTATGFDGTNSKVHNSLWYQEADPAWLLFDLEIRVYKDGKSGDDYIVKLNGSANAK